MATLTITQPDGAGAFPANEAADGLWIGVPVTLTLSGGQQYEHTILDQTSGMTAVLTGDQTPAASFTPNRTGSLRIRSRVKSGGVWSAFTRVLRVQRDAAGVELAGGIVAPALGESPGEAPGIDDGRGYAEQYDALVDAVAGASPAAEGARIVRATLDAPADTAALEAAFATSGVILIYGDVKVTHPVVMPPIVGDREIIFMPGSSLGQHSSWSGAGATSVDNALILLRETEAAQAPTTPADAKTWIGATTLNVVSSAGVTGWAKTLGVNAANDYANQSAGTNVPPEELLLIGDVVGNALTLAQPLKRHVGQNNAVAPFRQVKFLSAVVDGVTFRNARFDAHGDASAVACAVSSTFARRLRFDGCSFKGFTRSALYFRGCHDMRGDLIMLGGNNTRIEIASCQDWNFQCDDEQEADALDRWNQKADAEPRYAWDYSSQSCNGVLTGSIRNAVAGVKAWGGNLIKVRARVSDIDFSVIADASLFPGVGALEYGKRGYVLDTGGNPIANAEFGTDNDIEITFTDCSIGNGRRYWTNGGSGSDVPEFWYAAVYEHDLFKSRIYVHNEDHASQPTDAGNRRWLAWAAQDCANRCSTHLTGFQQGHVHTGVYSLSVFEPCSFDCAAGGSGGTLTEAAILIDGCYAGLPVYREVRPTVDIWQVVAFYPNFVFTKVLYQQVLIETLRYSFFKYPEFSAWGPFVARDIVIARLPNAAAWPADPGVVYPLDTGAADGERHILAAPAAAPTQGGFVVLTATTLSNTAGATIRPVIGVLAGPGAVCPLFSAASQTLEGRQDLECDASGRAIALTNGAGVIETLRKQIGKARLKCVAGVGGSFFQAGP